jgi:hypothetical protein
MNIITVSFVSSKTTTSYLNSFFLCRHNETYTWKNINCTVHGVIVGKLWIEHHGTMEITCPESGLSLSLHFKPAGWFNKELHMVDGFIIDSKYVQE